MKNLLVNSLIATSILVTSSVATVAQEIGSSREIRSVSQFKNVLRGYFSDSPAWCSSRSCLAPRDTYICDLVTMLDARVNGQITGRGIRSSSPLSIAEEDLNLMKTIWRDCKVVNANTVSPYLEGTTTIYSGSCQERNLVREAFGLNLRDCKY